MAYIAFIVIDINEWTHTATDICIHRTILHAIEKPHWKIHIGERKKESRTASITTHSHAVTRPIILLLNLPFAGVAMASEHLPNSYWHPLELFRPFYRLVPTNWRLLSVLSPIRRVIFAIFQTMAFWHVVRVCVRWVTSGEEQKITCS